MHIVAPQDEDKGTTIPPRCPPTHSNERRHLSIMLGAILLPVLSWYFLPEHALPRGLSAFQRSASPHKLQAREQHSLNVSSCPGTPTALSSSCSRQLTAPGRIHPHRADRVQHRTYRKTRARRSGVQRIRHGHRGPYHPSHLRVPIPVRPEPAPHPHASVLTRFPGCT